MQAKISVVLPVYNGSKTLYSALLSIYYQTKDVDELIVINDGSVDESESIINGFRSILPIFYIKNETNLGIAKSLIRGFAAASGDWIFRIDSDDIWLPSHVESLAKIINDPGVVLISSRAFIKRRNESQPCLTKCLSDKNIRERLLWDNPMIHSAVAINYKAYTKVGGYNQDVRWEDYDLWIKLLSIGRFAFSSTPTVVYVAGENSLSRINRKSAFYGRWRCQLFAYHSLTEIVFYKRFAMLILGYLRCFIFWRL